MRDETRMLLESMGRLFEDHCTKQVADAAAERRPRLKVLFMSGYTENAIVHHGRLDPGVLLLSKPFRATELARMVRTAMAGNHGSDA